MIKARCTTQNRWIDGPVHAHFRNSAEPYFVVSRLALSGMPVWWQRLFVWAIDMLPPRPAYYVTRRGERGHFMHDPWADFHRGEPEKILYRENCREIGQILIAQGVEPREVTTAIARHNGAKP